MEQRLSSPRQPLAQRLAFGGLFLALGILFPLLFHLLPARSGEIFLPMHIPVILAGMVLGPALDAAVGALTPLLNTLVGSMPPPARLPFMMIELGVYALAAGLCYRKARLPLPLSLAVTQLAGRAAYGLSLFFAGTLLHVEKIICNRNSGKPEPGTSVAFNLCIERNTYRLWGSLRIRSRSLL